MSFIVYGGCVHWTPPFLVDLFFHKNRLTEPKLRHCHKYRCLLGIFVILNVYISVTSIPYFVWIIVWVLINLNKTFRIHINWSYEWTILSMHCIIMKSSSFIFLVISVQNGAASGIMVASKSFIFKLYLLFQFRKSEQWEHV
jgi:hypothetical protein